MNSKLDLETLYENHVEMVFNLSLNYVRNREDAQEITQDVFLKVHSSLERFEGRSDPKTWIYRITVNKCLDHLRAQKRRRQYGSLVRLFGVSADEYRGFEVPDLDHPGIQLEDKEALEILFRQMDKLPAKQRTALLLKTTEGLSQKEIAVIMKVGIKAVESYLSRAKKNLRNLRSTEG